MEIKTRTIWKSPNGKRFYLICLTTIRIKGNNKDGVCITQIGGDNIITTTVEEFLQNFKQDAL